MEKNKKEAWLKIMLKKIFTNQKLGLAITVIGTIIAYFEWRDSRSDSVEEKYEKIQEKQIFYHDKLTLRLGNFDIKDQSTVNVDVITKNYDSIGHIPFRVGIYNGGDISATNVKGMIDGYLPKNVWSMDPFEDKIEDNENIFKINSITPKAVCGVLLMYWFPVKKQGDSVSFTITCTCDNKRNPITVRFNLRFYEFSSVDLYADYILSNVIKSEENLNLYWSEDDNFVLFISKEKINNEISLNDSFEKVFFTEKGFKLKSLN